MYLVFCHCHSHSHNAYQQCLPSKGQLILKCLLGVFTFFQKMNENKSTGSKVKFVRSFFGRNVGLQKTFRFCLTFSSVQKHCKFIMTVTGKTRYMPLLNSLKFMFSKKATKIFIIDSTLKTDSKRMSLYKWLFYEHFHCHMHVHLSKNWSSDSLFEVLSWSKFWLVQNLWHKTQIFLFLFFSDF